jgi:hypothetical protein
MFTLMVQLQRNVLDMGGGRAFEGQTLHRGVATAFVKWSVEIGNCPISACRSCVALLVTQSRKIEMIS